MGFCFPFSMVLVGEILEMLFPTWYEVIRPRFLCLKASSRLVLALPLEECSFGVSMFLLVKSTVEVEEGHFVRISQISLGNTQKDVTVYIIVGGLELAVAPLHHRLCPDALVQLVYAINTRQRLEILMYMEPW